MDYIEAHSSIGFAIYMLDKISDLPENKAHENGFIDSYSPQVFVYVRELIKCKKALMLPSSKKDKKMLELAKVRMQHYIKTVELDEQIAISKFIN